MQSLPAGKYDIHIVTLYNSNQSLQNHFVSYSESKCSLFKLFWSNSIASPGWPPLNSRCWRWFMLCLGTLCGIWHIWSCSSNWPPWALGCFSGSAMSWLDSLYDVARLVGFGEHWFEFFGLTWGLLRIVTSLYTLLWSSLCSACQTRTLHESMRISWSYVITMAG